MKLYGKKVKGKKKGKKVGKTKKHWINKMLFYISNSRMMAAFTGSIQCSICLSGYVRTCIRNFGTQDRQVAVKVHGNCGP